MANGNSSYVNIDGGVGYDLEGRVTNYQTSVTQGQLDTAYNYQRDGLGRLTGLTWGANTLVSNVVYGAAGQLQQMVYNDTSIGGGFTETRTYNTNLQLTQIAATPTSGTGMNLPVPVWGGGYSQQRAGDAGDGSGEGGAGGPLVDPAPASPPRRWQTG